MSGIPPSVAEFKAQFVREFIYGGGLNTVTDGDIQRAINETQMVFNTALWANDAQGVIAYNYAAAHFMVLNIQSAGGLSSAPRQMGVLSHGGGTIESKGVGSVNVGYAVPDFVRQSPILSQFMRTDFGQIYLQLLTPRLVGNIGVVSGSATASFAGNVNPLKITTLSVVGGTVSTPYTQTLVSIGGVMPLAWTLVSGTLPTGLSLNAVSGVISGTPSAAGTFYFEIRVTDGRNKTATMNYQVVIAP